MNLRELTSNFMSINKVDKAVWKTEENMEEEINGEEASKKKKGSDLKTEILILSEATQSGYDQIQKSLFTQFKSTVSKNPLFPHTHQQITLM